MFEFSRCFYQNPLFQCWIPFLYSGCVIFFFSIRVSNLFFIFYKYVHIFNGGMVISYFFGFCKIIAPRYFIYTYLIGIWLWGARVSPEYNFGFFPLLVFFPPCQFQPPVFLSSQAEVCYFHVSLVHFYILFCLSLRSYIIGIFVVNLYLCYVFHLVLASVWMWWSIHSR